MHVHLIERLLLVLRVTGSHLHQIVPMSEDRTYGADCLGWTERSVGQTHRVKILQPLTVGNIGLASGHILHMTCV
ncbi:MAG: hypothetical protein DMG50_06885 [Acidobacteria bacterium]|nr:MAG: hypothetical protein DMG50_06885 [Acidobacteriota bacterium]